MFEEVDGGVPQASLLRCNLRVMESQAGERVTDSGDMGRRVGLEDEGVANIHANTDKTFRDTVHET